MMIDADGQVVSSPDLPTSSIYGLMKFSQMKHRQYGLDDIKSIKDLDKKLDKGISSMEIEINLKKEQVRQLSERYQALSQQN